MTGALARDPIVITGMGSVLSCGSGASAVSKALESGKPILSKVDNSAGFHHARAGKLAALADTVDLSPWLKPRAARRLSQPSRYAVAAARMALNHAELDFQENGIGNAAVVLGTAFGTARFAEALVRDILTRGPEAASPFHFSESVANAPAAQVAISVGAHGSNVAVTQREASPLIAVALGARELALGRSDMALVGATDEVNPLVHAILGRFGALAVPDPNGNETSRPFSPDHPGFLAAEGASILVLERLSSARARGAQVLARLPTAIRAFDATAPPWGWGSGTKALTNRLKEQLQRASILPSSIDLVVSGASGAVDGDRLEEGILGQLFLPGSPPRIETPKEVLGEFGGGALIAAVLALQETHHALNKNPKRILTSSLAAGGAAAWLVLESP